VGTNCIKKKDEEKHALGTRENKEEQTTLAATIFDFPEGYYVFHDNCPRLKIRTR
jgi:hypothetical protein